MAKSPSSVSVSQRDASRFLAQATFGPNFAEISRLQTIGFASWLTEQFAVVPQSKHQAYLDSVISTGVTLSDNHIAHTFWKQAATGQDQLRQRIVFALSQIFVVSLQDSNVARYRRGVGSYLDMLGRESFGNYRSLLESVTRHPMMGLYLSHLKNQKEDPSRNRVPDQNFAREVMQLFSIGLYHLNIDGTQKLSNGLPIETYNSNDVIGLSRVFTGFSWAGPDKLSGRFYGNNTPAPDPNRDVLPMQSYPNFHSLSEKRFLGVVIPPQTTATPDPNLAIALDTLAAHSNVGPFLGRQLIQRLVTSNPSPAYIARVAQAFNSGRFTFGTSIFGTGVRGDLKATITAVLLDREARATPSLNNPNFGRVREPILRMANWMRAFSVSSTSGNFLLNTTDDPATSLGQTPMRSPSVFNFYRPGYVPPNTSIASAGLVSPEMQIVTETAVIGYSNFMRSVVQSGAGSGTPRDIQPNYSAEIAIADRPDVLVARLDLLLTFGTMSSATKAIITNAIASIPLPATNQTTARTNRVMIGVLFTLSAPDYLVQK